MAGALLQHSRRTVVTRGGALWASLATGASPVLAAVKTNAVGNKFYPDGRVRPFPGNTILCHLPQQGPRSEAFDALLDIYRAARDHAFLENASLLPPSSYHMTVFEGVTEATRRRPDAWPAGVPPTASLEDCDKIIAQRLKAFRLDTALPLRMAVDVDAITPSGGAIVIPLKPVDVAEALKLRDLRRRLSSAVGIGVGDPDTYRFHISLAYWIRALTTRQEAEYDKAHRLWRASLARAAPVIELGAPEYCLFDDMFAFHRQFYLA